MKSFVLSEQRGVIRQINLKNSNLMQKETDSNKLSLTSSKSSTFRKGINNNKKLFLYKINSRTKFNLKNKNYFSTANINSNSLPEKYKTNLKMNYQPKISKLFKRGLLLPKYFNIYIPNITSVKINSKNPYLRKSNDTKYKGTLMKSDFSENYKATSVSSGLNLNLIINKTTSSSKKSKISSNQIYLKKKNSDEDLDKYKESEKNIFEAKLKKKKIIKFLKEKLTYKNRKKYSIIRAPENNFQFLKSMDMPESISKINKKFNSILLKENISVFRQPIDIIRKGQFSKKFENPRNIEVRQSNRKNINIKDIHFGDYIIKNVEEINKKSKRDTKIILKKFRKKMMEIYLIKQNLTIPISEIIRKYKIPRHSLNLEQTRCLNYFIKEKELNCALSILSSNHHLAIGIDQFSMTPLHYAAKKNFYQIIPYLMNYGAYVDAKNLYGKTPLMFCLKRNYYESTIILFSYLADPFEINNINSDIKENDLDKNSKNILEEIKNIHIKNKFYSDKNFYLGVKNDIYKFVMRECQDLFESDFIDLVKIICKIK